MFLAGSILMLSMPFGLRAETNASEPVYQLPPLTVSSPRVANQTPGGVMATPVSALRYEPLVDIQARNTAEAQGDVSIRGGTFENSGFKLGAVSLYDPQTGHYFAEIPVSPAMLQAPVVLTGSDNALGGFSANVGTIAYGWRPIQTRGEAAVSAGEYGYNRQSFYQGMAHKLTSGRALAADVEYARSESDGTLAYGDHNFSRIAGRVQLRGAHSQTDLFAGYQSKFFGWPNLYAYPFNGKETEDIQTALFILNHRINFAGSSDYLELGTSHRENDDYYVFNRLSPPPSVPFHHRTRATTVSAEGRYTLSTATVLHYRAGAVADKIVSTRLTVGATNGRYDNRVQAYAGFAGERTLAWDNRGNFTLLAGANIDVSNRDSTTASPVAAVTFAPTAGALKTLRLSYDQTTQLPTYTALNSSSAGGLFRGNRNLARAKSRNAELAATAKLAGWEVQTAVFQRWDDSLVDFTYDSSLGAGTARRANAVDIRTLGWELVAAHRTPRFDLTLGAGWLQKNADYRGASVDASFYALNFPVRRLTAALTWRLGAGVELRSDNEYRIQETNKLRANGVDEATLSSFGLYWLPPRLRGWEFSALVDNLWDSQFQEVPGVPASRRQLSFGAAFRW